MPGKPPKGFWGKFKHAFAIDVEAEAITPEEEVLLAKVASAVVRRGLEVPAEMFLESVRPLSFLGSQTLVFLQPIIGMVLNPVEIEKFSRLLEKRGAVPRLIAIIEEQTARR